MQNTQIIHSKVTDKTTSLEMATRRVEKTENILSAVLLLTNSFRNENKMASFQDASVKVLIGKIETVVYDAADNFYNNKSKIKDNLQAVVFYINALKLKSIISDDNHMSLIIAYSTVISAFEILESKQNNYINGETKITIKDIDLKLDQVEDLEDFVPVHLTNQEHKNENKNYTQESELEENKKDKNKIGGGHGTFEDAFLKRQAYNNSNQSKSAKETNTQKEVKDNTSKSASSFNLKRLDSVLGTNIKNIRDIKISSDILSNKRQDSRRNEILRLLSDNPITIKDISEKVLGCSEKTIQRELNSMLDDNIIQRIGEKRWSKYVLA